MFSDLGRYAKWFYGQLGFITNYTPKGADGKPHCTVTWLQPVEYHGKYTKVSHFGSDKFEVISESR